MNATAESAKIMATLPVCCPENFRSELIVLKNILNRLILSITQSVRNLVCTSLPDENRMSGARLWSSMTIDLLSMTINFEILLNSPCTA